VPVEGYDETTYGDRFADVYDEWYTGISDVEVTVAELVGLAGPGPVLELGVGTGRLAVPLARHPAGLAVTGIDASAAMLDRLRTRDPDGTVTAVRGDMAADQPPGPFTLIFVAYNTLFNLTGDGAHAACFRAAADRLVSGGRFVVEAFVPDETRDGDDVAVRSLTADRVVLSVTVHDAANQTAEGQFVEITDVGGVRLRPWSIAYRTPSQLDAMAAAAGLDLEHRWEAFDRTPFAEDSPRHVSVYRKP
jgi:trans-aconitate methyltransferase